MRWPILLLLLTACASTPAPRAYRAWTAPMWDQWTRGDTCRVTVFARAEGLIPVRISSAEGAGVVETIALGHSHTVEVPVDHRYDKAFVFIDVETQEILAVRKVSFRCYKGGK